MLSWRLSIAMEASFCVATLEDTLGLVTASRTSSIPIRVRSSRAGPSPWVLANNKFAISIDGKGAWRDNVFVERLRRGLTILPTGSGSRVGTLRTLLLSGYPADDRTVNYLTIP